MYTYQKYDYPKLCGKTRACPRFTDKPNALNRLCSKAPSLVEDFTKDDVISVPNVGRVNLITINNEEKI